MNWRRSLDHAVKGRMKRWMAGILAVLMTVGPMGGPIPSYAAGPYTITYQSVWKDGSPIENVNQPGEGRPVSANAGEALTIKAPDYIAAIPQCEMQKVTIEQGSDGTLMAEMGLGQSGKVTGNMPSSNVIITYHYTDEAPIRIHWDGGTPQPGWNNGMEIDPYGITELSGVKGADTGVAEPTTVTRPGYTLYSSNTVENWDPVAPSLWPTKYPFFAQGTDYYFIFRPNLNQTAAYSFKRTNADGSIVFEENQAQYSAEKAISEPSKTIAGYTGLTGSSRISPDQAFYHFDVQPIGSIGTNGSFTGWMPAEPLSVESRYQVTPGFTSQLSIQYKTENGNDVAPKSQQSYAPEETVSIEPLPVPGFTCVGYNIVQGATAGPFTGDYPVICRQNQDREKYGYRWDEDDSFHMTGPMPNQNVSIIFEYKPTADNKHTVTVTSQDNGTIDESLKELRPARTYGPWLADKAVGDSNFTNPYGYTAQFPNGWPTPPPGPNDSYVEYDTTAPYYNPNWGNLGDPITLWPAQDRWSGTMPPNPAVIHYKYNRIPQKWIHVTYKAGLGGTLLRSDPGQTPEYTASPDVHDQTPGGDGKAVFKADILGNDGSSAGGINSYTLRDVKDKHLIPAGKPDSDAYIFAGWFFDLNTDGKRDGNELLLDDNYRFTINPADPNPLDQTLTASFEKDPAKWLTVTFEAGPNGTMLPPVLPERTSYEGRMGTTWGEMKAEGVLPTHFTANQYFVGGGWYQKDGLIPMTDDMILEPNAVYVYQFLPDPSIFGTDVSKPQAQGGLNSYGEGRIVVYQAAMGYQYVLTGIDGRVLAVNDMAGAMINRSRFDHLYPGTRYQVYEARGTLKIKEGDQISTFQPGQPAADGKPDVSEAAEVLTPVVDTNYQIYFDEKQEGKVVLSIKPADRDSDYGLLDEAGQVVKTPQTGADGWQHLKGDAEEIRFSGLGYNKTYTVVACPKNAEGVSPESKQDDGTQIITDPGGVPQVKNYTIQVIHGTVTKAGDQDVNTDHFETAHKGDEITISADPVNSAGQPFIKWELLIGPDKEWDAYRARSGEERTFAMPEANLVLNAVYRDEPNPGSPSNADVTYEIRGDKPGQFVLDPDAAKILEQDLTTDLDRDLIAIPGAHNKVTYKVIYQKNEVAATESDAIKQSDDYINLGMDQHETAYRPLTGLNITIERYVNGRRVELDPASASSAQHAFRTYAQVGKDDKNMLDYQLYEISTRSDGSPKAELVPMNYPMESTGGLSDFELMQGGRYVLVCSRAYPVHFMSFKPPEPEDKIDQTILIRKGEYLSDDPQYPITPAPIDWFINSDGAEYNYLGWANSPNDREPTFRDDRPIVRPTDVWACYKDNTKEVADAREELEKKVYDTRVLAADYFLRLDEVKTVTGFLNSALETLDQTEPHKATQQQLEDAIRTLSEKIKPYQDILEIRYHDYHNMQDDSNKGGSGGGGGSGSGSKSSPYSGTLGSDYTVGTNGNWVEETVNGQRQLSFVLNGGLRLSGMWAKLTYPDGPQGLDAAKNGWYHFNNDGVMETGWITDQTGSWYYLNTEAEGACGKMATEWKQDPASGWWYYFDPVSGAMQTGWKEIGGKQYYLNPTPPDNTGAGKPLGAMYQNETTPDGHQVGPDGAKN